MSKPITLDEFIRRSIVKHGHKYDYSKVKYKNQYDMVDIICPFEPRSVFGGEVEYKSQIDRDKRKDEYCISNNIKIIRIGYKDFTKLDSILTKLLLKESRIYDYTNFVTFYMV